jgi:hypothetical protein
LAALIVDFHLIRLSTQIGPQLHGLPQRVNGGIGHLGGIEQEVIPVDRIGPIAPHASQKHSARLRLLGDISQDLERPVSILLDIQRILPDGKSSCGTKSHTAMAAHTFGAIAENAIVLGIV